MVQSLLRIISSRAGMEVVGSVRRGLLLILLGYLLSRIIIAYRKMREGQIGTLFHRINSPTVQVDGIAQGKLRFFYTR